MTTKSFAIATASVTHNFLCDDDPKTVDCFCNGAVLSDGTPSPDHDVDRGFLVVVVINSSTKSQFAGTNTDDPSLAHRSHFPPLVSGRDICTLVGSHLL